MVKSLYTGVSGMKAHQQRMDVIGNNVANVNTVGYKTDVVTFKDSFYQVKRSPSGATSTLGGVNPRMVGYGVQVNAVEANMSQSGYTQSDKVEDLAINGNGFFQVMDGSGNIYYTRQGNFHFDDYGYLVNADGYHVLGVNGNSEGQQPGTEIIRAVIPDTNANTSSATKLVNGTNVTLSVTAPSNYTNMTVSFVDSNYPFATFSDSILTVFFNREQQFEDEAAFEQAISNALKAGGVSLPDDVELKFSVDNEPSDKEAVAASNSVEGFLFSTTNSTCDFISNTAKTGEKASGYAVLRFSTDGVNDCKDSITIKAGTKDDPVKVAYNNGEWEITINESTIMADITKALKDYSADHPEIPYDLSVKSFTFPTGTDKAAIITEWNDKKLSLQGVKEGDKTGALSLSAKVRGEFANNYKVTFAYIDGYDKTSAAWDENNLTINVCANSTITDVNEAIRKAANGNDKKVLTFDQISGLDYGYKEETYKDGTDNVTKTTYVNGYSKTVKGTTTTWQDAGGNTINEPADFATNKIYSKKDDGDVWPSSIRNAFFSGNPSIRPMDGKDAFYTELAKDLGTFALENGRTGSAQSWGNITDYTIQADGRIIAKHEIHGYIEIGRIDLATFDNNNGLQKVGGTMFKETVASGPVKLNVPTKDGAGEIVSGALEMSNVDLADEFTNMITTQRGYQANSRVITVSDTMIEELLSLKR